MQVQRGAILILSFLAFCSGFSLRAGPIAIGFLSYDVNSPTANVNSISVNNYTGPTLGCGLTDPGLPVCTALALAGTLTIDFLDGLGAHHEVFSTLSSPIGPSLLGGIYPPGSSFPLDDTILSATFLGSITPLNLTLAGSIPYLATGVVTSDVLTPSNGTALLYITDLTSAPEPGTGMIMLLALGCAGVRRRLLRRN